MKKKFLGRVLTMLLVASMVFTLLPAPAIAAGNWWWNTEEYTEEAVPTATTDNSNFMRIFHLDCGRKYFTKDAIINIIDTAAKCGYTHVELAFGNDGLRFLLDDMSLTVDGTEYDKDAVKTAIQNGNKKYYDAGEYNELTESQMTAIIAYAKDRNIGVIPLIDIPGHTNALVWAMEELKISQAYYQSNENTAKRATLALDVKDTVAVSFATELVKKYVDYFAANDAAYFNVGADECGYDNHYDKADYQELAKMIGTLSDYIHLRNMTTLIFNDGFRTNGYLQTALRDRKNQIKVCYWTYSEYTTPTDLAEDFELINTHNKWYYVAGNDNGGWNSYQWAKSNLNGEYKDCTIVDGAKDENYRTNTGCMLAYWCDEPSKTYNSEYVADLIKTLADNNPDYFKTTAAPDKPGTKLDEREITVTVGGTATDKIDGSYEDSYTTENPNVATVTATNITVSGQPEFKQGSKISVHDRNNAGPFVGVITDGNGHYMTVNGDVIGSTDKVSEATKFTVKRTQVSGSGYRYSISAGSKYLSIGSNEVTLSNNEVNLQYDNDKGFFYHYTYVFWNYDYYIYYDNGKWTGAENAGNGFLYSVEEVPTAPVEKTLVTFNGLAKGDTYVTIGNVYYTIHVTEEDLSKAPTLPIQLWITSQTIAVDQDGMKSKQTSGNFGSRKPQYLEISATDKLNTPEGRPLSECVPELIEKHYENDGTWWTTELSNKQPFDFMLWKGTVLKSGSIQTVWGTSRINEGTDFAYVRYLGGKWQVSNDRSEWTTVTGDGSTVSSDSCEEQLVAYYYMQTKLTDDVTTNIVDWGDPYESQTATDYVLLDFAVKTETGEATPAISSFPMKERTLYYHCKKDSDACGTDSNNNRYRRIDQIEARNTGEYEIYMITLTPTADSAATKLASTCNGNAAGSDIYKGTEKVVWVKDADTLQKTEFADENLWYTSPSGNTKFDSTDTTGKYVDGKAELSNVEIYNKQGLLVTYYVRSTAEHKVFVHYIDNKTQTPFHTVEISVPTGTTYFSHEFGMSGGKLINNTVQGVNHIETVQSDLQQLPLVPALYRRANYTLTAANLGDNTTTAKDAYLYYDFSNAESFVVDFGLPLTITPKDVGNLGTATITNTKISYNGGLADISATTDGTITYKLNKPLGKTPDSFSVTYTGPSLSGTETKGDVDVTFTIYIYPASNVLYEENFLTEAPASSGRNWTEVTSNKLGSQQTQKVGGTGSYNVFGRDTAYDNATGELGVWTATGLEFSTMTKALTTEFYGNGFDLIGNCGPDTGRVMIAFTKQGANVPCRVVMVNTRFNDSSVATTLHQVPWAHVELGVDDAMYKVEIFASGNETNSSRTMFASGYAAETDAFDSILAAYGMSASDVEYINVADTITVPSAYAVSYASVAADVTANQTIEVDGFRVYRSTNNDNYPANEKNVTYNNILDVVKGEITAYTENGNGGAVQVTEYEKNGGPQNEIYLGKNQTVTFAIENVNSIQVSLRAVNGPAKWNGTDIMSNTEMYYTLTKDNSGVFTIANSGNNLLAIGNVKIPGNAGGIQTASELPADVVLASVRMALGASGESNAFDPAISAKVTTTRFIRSKVVTLTVSASADVEKLMVNGVELRPTNSWLVKMGWSDTYTYILTEKVQKNETKTYEIVGYRADGAASETIVVKSK